MKTNRIGVFGLQLRIALARLGWNNCAGILLCAAAAFSWLWGIPYLHARANAQQSALLRAQQALDAKDLPTPATAPTPAIQHLTDFHEVLGEAGYTEQQVGTLFALAEKNGLTLSHAEYKLVHDKDGRYQRYQIVLPIKGDYRNIREFCEQTLLTIPFASLDQINFKRESIASGTLEARLRLTLYLSAEPQTQIHTGPAPGGML